MTQITVHDKTFQTYLAEELIQEKVKELETRQKAGLNVTAELITARLDLLKAKGELLTAVTDWHAAEVKLRQAMALLIRE